MKQSQIIILFVVLLLCPISSTSQTKLEGTFVSRLENKNVVNTPGFRFVFTKESMVTYYVFTDCVPFPYGRGTYIIDEDFLTLNFETIPYAERDTLFVHKKITVDSSTFLDSVYYKFTFLSADSSFGSRGLKVCFYDFNNKLLNTLCLENNSAKPLTVSFPYKFVPFELRIFNCLLYVTNFKVLDYYCREISIGLKKDWAQEHDFLNAGDVIKFRVKSLSEDSFYMLVGKYWYHCVKQ